MQKHSKYNRLWPALFQPLPLCIAVATGGMAAVVQRVKSALHSNGEETLCRLLDSCTTTCSRREVLLTYLGLSPEGEPKGHPGEYGRESLMADLLVQTLNFAVESGLPHTQVYHFLCLYVHCLEFLCPHHPAAGS